MNISKQSAFHACTSCGVCATVCAKKAITIQLDCDGFYRPALDDSLCNDCGLCTTVCYKYDNDVLITSSNELEGKPLFAAWSNDDELVKQTTSGGIGDLLAHQLQQEGYKVVGVIYNEDRTRAEHSVAKCENDILSFRGSKYIQSYTYDAFKQVVDNCRNEKYAVFGTPCQTYALNRLVTKRNVRGNFFFVDLFCHGCPSLYAWTKYQKKIKEKIGIEKFDQVIFRSKVKGWGAFYVVVVVDGKPVFIGDKVNDKFYELFFSDQILNESCHDCKLRSTLEYTDIRLGDFWGKKYLKNYRGVSAVSVSTERGKEVFNSIKNQITLEVCKYEVFLPWQSWGKTYVTDSNIRDAVLNSLKNPSEDIDNAIKVLHKNQTVLNNIKRIAKTMLSIFPLRVLNLMKRIKYSL